MASQHEIVAEEWKERSRELAEWAMEKLVNRKDVWGQYASLTPGEQKKLGRTYKAMTLPVASKRGPDMVTLDKLTRHFASAHHQRPQIIGLHAKSKENTSRWLGIDIDMHDDTKADAEEHARRNLVGAINWWRQLQGMGYDPLLFDSNNNGGYHLWVLFDEPAPTEHVFAFAWSLVSTWRENNLSEEPETFPKKLQKDKLGAWFRLPGLHHTRNHYARVWSGDEWLDDPWLAGHAAIDAMLQCVGGPPPPVDSGPEEHSRTTLRSPKADMGAGKAKSAAVVKKSNKRAADRKRKFKRSGKATVCIDLDGVLAEKNGVHSIDIGDPVDGAVEYSRAVAAFAKVVILTSRLAATRNSRKRQAHAKDIENWLDEHGFAYDEVYTGLGKPAASAYVDDRGVSCRPQQDGIAAFEQSIKLIELLCNQ
jgi:hypothetical protein